MKKRKIRYERLALVIFIGLVLVGLLSILLCKGVSIVIEAFNKEETYETGHVDPGCYSCSIVNRVVIDSTPSYIDLGEFKLTGYCNCEQCCGQWAGGPTYSGVMPTANHTIAVDKNVIPIGSHVLINGQEYVAEDTGSAIKGNRIDVYCDSHSDCFDDSCNGYAEVYLVKE